MKVNLGLSNSFVSKDVIVYDFNGKLELHATAINLHVFNAIPTWLGAATNTGSRVPYLNFTDSHKNNAGFSFRNSCIFVIEDTLLGVDF